MSKNGLLAARSGWAEVLVVDRMLSGGDGLSIIEALRKDGDLTPVLVISALSSVDERIIGLKAGGDDYLVKPFDARELSARVAALFRRGSVSRAIRLKAGDSGNGPGRSHRALLGRAVDLLPQEFKLLEYFMRRPGQIVTRAMLLEDVWNFKFMAPDQRRRRAHRQRAPQARSDRQAEVHRQCSRGRVQTRCRRLRFFDRALSGSPLRSALQSPSLPRPLSRSSTCKSPGRK